MRGASGYWGKVPGAGDFVGRGLPIEFTKRWDRWMEMSLPEALARGGGGGVWCFVARKGVFGRDPVCGAFALSRDRVGRKFPFLVCATGAMPPAPDRWFRRAAEAVIEARRAPDAAAVAAIVEGVGHPGRGGARLDDAARFWLVGSREPIVFASAQSLAVAGLQMIFDAGGPPEPLPAPGEMHEDPGADWAPAYVDGAALSMGEPEPLDLDEMLGSAGLLDMGPDTEPRPERWPEPGPAAARPPAPAASTAMPAPPEPGSSATGSLIPDGIPEDFGLDGPSSPPTATPGAPPEMPSSALDSLDPSVIGRGGDPLLDLLDGDGRRLERPLDPGPDPEEAAKMMERPSAALAKGVPEEPGEDDRLDIDDLLDFGGSGDRR